MTSVNIILEDDPTPLVLIFANKFRKACADTKYATKLMALNGCFAMASTVQPQSLSIHISPGQLRLEKGINKRAKIIIRMDFDKPDGAKVERLWRYPLFAKQVGDILDFPAPDWQTCLESFWEKFSNYPGMPEGMNITISDKDKQLNFGDSESALELTAKSSVLASVFSGEEVFIQAVIQGKIKLISSFEASVVLSEITLDMMLGDL